MTFTAADLPEGITFRSTPQHGYWDLSAAKLADMPEALQRKTPFYTGNGVFEEDQEYNRVVAAFPEAFPAEWVDNAHRILKDHLPDIYEEWTGTIIPLEESYKKRERAFDDANRDNYIALSATGDWHQDVPDGMVGIFAGRGGYVKVGELGLRYPDDTKEFLVSAERYDNRQDGLSYVVDLEVDQMTNWDND